MNHDRRPIASRIYDLLLQRILDMDLKPREELSEARLAAEFGVSRTPVREALARLARQDLIDVYPQRGSLVAPIRVELVAKARFIRDALERPLARLAAERLPEGAAARMEREIALQRTFAGLSDDQSFLLSDDRFHGLISEAAGFGSIWEDIAAAKFHMDRVRRLSLLSQNRMLAIVEEHAQILGHIRAHDSDGAERSVGAHLRSVFTEIDAIRHVNPDYFLSEDARR